MENTCSICYEEYEGDDLHHQRHCKHVICKDCREDLILHDPTSKAPKYPCPLCLNDAPSDAKAAVAGEGAAGNVKANSEQGTHTGHVINIKTATLEHVEKGTSNLTNNENKSNE